MDQELCMAETRIRKEGRSGRWRRAKTKRVDITNSKDQLESILKETWRIKTEEETPSEETKKKNQYPHQRTSRPNFKRKEVESKEALEQEARRQKCCSRKHYAYGMKTRGWRNRKRRRKDKQLKQLNTKTQYCDGKKH